MQNLFKMPRFLQVVAFTAVIGGTFSLAGAQTTANEPVFSSSVSDEAPAVETAAVTPHVDFANLMLMQYGGRRSGRPRYRGGNTTQDGVEKYTFFGGAGFTAPVGQQSNYLTPSYSFQVGFGRNFDKHTSLNAQFDWDNFGFTAATISNQSNVYTGDPTDQSFGIDGNSHIWSFTLNPEYNIYSGEGLGAYVVVGGGFYHKTANFFAPELAQGCDIYGCYEYQANATIQNFTSNSAGVNGGFGVTYKFSRFSNEKLYAEVRVVHTFNQYKPGLDPATASNSQIASYTGWNYFPENSQETTYFPVKVGIRF